MSEVTLAAKTAEVAKPKAKKQKSEMSYQDALKAINVYDSQLKEAGKHRMFDPQTVTDRLTVYQGFKNTAFLLATMGAEIVAISNDVIPTGGVGFLTMVGTMFGGIVGIAVTSGNKRYQKLFSPLKVKKLQAEYEVNLALQALKEEEFATLEEGILKQAKKPMKVIEKRLTQENRSIVYSGDMGSEGFSIQEVTEMSVWEKELLKETNTQAKELNAPSQKSLTV